MAARALALAATLVLAGCGAQTYSASEVRRAVDPQVPPLVAGGVGFATWAAVTDLELDPNPLYTVYAGENVDILRFRSEHDARAQLRAGLFVMTFAGEDFALVRRRNLIVEGERSAVRRALARLP